MDIQVDTPFVLHPQLERITPPDALRPYTVPGKPGPLQNGRFTPFPYKTANDYRNEFLSALSAMAMKRGFDNKIKGIQDGQANDVLERMSQQFNERGAPAYKPDLNNPLLQDPRNALYKQQADDVFNRMAKQFNDRGEPVSKAQAAISKANSSAQQVAKSKAAQAKLNNADWAAKYREMSKNATPRVDPISMQSQMVAVLRDPVYGQATATGLAAGEGMLNSWIAGINSRARKDEGNLANERWIKQIQDLDEDRKLRRDELAEAKKTPLESVDFDPIYFASKEDTDKYNQMISDPVFKAQVAKDPITAFNILEARKAKQKQIDEFSKNVKRSVMPDRKTIDEVVKREVANAGGDFTKELEALDSMGKLSKGNFWNRMFNDSDFQIKVADKLENQRGNRATRSFKNLAQYQNMLSNTGHMNEARMLGTLIRDQLKGADPILEVIAGEAEDSPVYIRTKGGAYVFEPSRPTELLPFVVE